MGQGKQGESRLPSMTPVCISLPSCPGQLQILLSFPYTIPLGEGQGEDGSSGGEDCESCSGCSFPTGGNLGSQPAGSTCGHSSLCSSWHACHPPFISSVPPNQSVSMSTPISSGRKPRTRMLVTEQGLHSFVRTRQNSSSLNYLRCHLLLNH